jgi:hypothetical protein
MKLLFVLSIVLVACQGEAVTTTSDAGATTCSVPNNLALNPSFEVGDNIPNNWKGALKPVTGGAHDCAKYAEWKTTEPFEIADQDIYLGEGFPAGTSFELSVYAKPLDGNAAGFNLYLEGGPDDYHEQPTGNLKPGAWTRVSATFTLKKPATSRVTIAFRSGTTELRAIALDLVALVRK